MNVSMSGLCRNAADRRGPTRPRRPHHRQLVFRARRLSRRADWTIWEKIAAISRSVPAYLFAGLPTDGASQHDHYIYGTPKRPV